MPGAEAGSLDRLIEGSYVVRSLRWFWRRRLSERGRFLLVAAGVLGLLGMDTRRALVFVLFCLAAAPLLVALPEFLRRAPPLRFLGQPADADDCGPLHERLLPGEPQAGRSPRFAVAVVGRAAAARRLGRVLDGIRRGGGSAGRALPRAAARRGTRPACFAAARPRPHGRLRPRARPRAVDARDFGDRLPAVLLDRRAAAERRPPLPARRHPARLHGRRLARVRRHARVPRGRPAAQDPLAFVGAGWAGRSSRNTSRSTSPASRWCSTPTCRSGRARPSASASRLRSWCSRLWPSTTDAARTWSTSWRPGLTCTR